CGFARVVFQEPPEPFTTLHGTWTLWILVDHRGMITTDPDANALGVTAASIPSMILPTPCSPRASGRSRMVKIFELAFLPEVTLPTRARASACFPPLHPPYSASRGTAKAEGSSD